MELEEAIEILQDRDMLIDTLYETYNQSTVKPFDKAIDAVINYIENESIPKEKVENKLEEIEEFETCVVIEEFQREAKIDVLKELLEE